MKIIEVTQSKITKIMPGSSAEIDHGDGTKTTVDLKKNPTALQKDAAGKVKLNKQQQGSETGVKKPAQIKAGDSVELSDEGK